MADSTDQIAVFESLRAPWDRSPGLAQQVCWSIAKRCLGRQLPFYSLALHNSASIAWLYDSGAIGAYGRFRSWKRHCSSTADVWGSFLKLCLLWCFAAWWVAALSCVDVVQKRLWKAHHRLKCFQSFFICPNSSADFTAASLEVSRIRRFRGSQLKGKFVFTWRNPNSRNIPAALISCCAALCSLKNIYLAPIRQDQVEEACRRIEGMTRFCDGMSYTLGRHDQRRQNR